MKTRIELSKSSRARCRTCHATIARGEPRIVEGILSDDNEHVTPGYHHVACVIQYNYVRAANVIASLDTPVELAEAALAVLDDAGLVASIRDRRAKNATRRARDDDPQTQALLLELEASPGDRGLLTVLADHLQQCGDERGELIMHDLAVSLEPDALARRRELTSALAPPLEPGERIGWGIGYLRKLELAHRVHAERVRTLIAHPSCRLLEVLVCNYDPQPVTPFTRDLLPRTLRRIELQSDLVPRSDFSGLPYLQHVIIDRATELSVRALEGAGKIIPRLTIRSYELGAQHRTRLEAVCEQLDFDDGTVEETPVVVERVEHATLGIGTIVRVVDDKIEVEFPGAGRKLFKRGAPFLRHLS